MQQYKVKFNYEPQADGTHAESSRTILDTGKTVDFPNVVVDVTNWLNGVPDTAIIEQTGEVVKEPVKEIAAPVKKTRKTK